MVSAAVLGECHNNAGHDASGANPATLLDRSSPAVCKTRSTQKISTGSLDSEQERESNRHALLPLTGGVCGLVGHLSGEKSAATAQDRE